MEKSYPWSEANFYDGISCIWNRYRISIKISERTNLSRAFILTDIMKVSLKILASMVLVVITMLLSISMVYLAVSISAKGKTYSSVKDIPYNRVGLVLGTSPFTSTEHSNYFFTTRINAAEELYKTGKVKKLIVSGNNHVKEYDEPGCMRDALIRKGVPSSAIVLDYAGFRTLDSVVRAKEVFGQEKITIISQRFHNERAIYLAEHYVISTSSSIKTL